MVVVVEESDVEQLRDEWDTARRDRTAVLIPALALELGVSPSQPGRELPRLYPEPGVHPCGRFKALT